ncbi:MAG: FKBP-type peptidyl-prolyl cis-trans isomerase [Planctomycetota bacterium]|nr:FKBP-type peptidyl-prolyl cis-trans isomerase [Planctomycetota bacterium]
MNSTRLYTLIAAFSLLLTLGCESSSDYIRRNQDYLISNQKQSDVTTTKSGLQYRVIKSGKKDSPSPTTSSSVIVHYEGKLINGEIFDSSYQRKKPIEFGVTQVIKGWTEALQLMKVGDVWEITIPHNLAYGPAGNPRIRGFSTLVFKVELIAFKG